MMKKALGAALKMGGGRPLLDRVFVTCPKPPPVNDLISTITGEGRPVFALLPGPLGPYRKVIVQAMRPDGEILGYIKIPLSPAAEERHDRNEPDEELRRQHLAEGDEGDERRGTGAHERRACRPSAKEEEPHGDERRGLHHGPDRSEHPRRMACEVL